jgi:hypothetical protein
MQHIEATGHLAMDLLASHTNYNTQAPPHTLSMEPQSYWETQLERNCLVHAYNMLQGHQCLTPERLQSHIRDVLRQDDMYLHTVHLEPTDLCTQQGDFSLHCLNHYCITTKNRAYIGKRIVFFTPLEAIHDTLCDHGHQGLLLTAESIGTNGHFTAIKRHDNGQYYVYDSLQSRVAELGDPYLQGIRDPKESRLTLLLLEIPRCTTYSTEPHGLHSLLDPPALRDALGTTSPWEHEGTLSVRTFQRQAGGSSLPSAINNAVGYNLVAPQALMHSRAATENDVIASLPENPCNPESLFAVSDFNSWASRHKLHLHLLGTEQHQSGCTWEASLHRAALRCTAHCWSPRGPPQLPDCAILLHPTGQFAAVVREPQTKQWCVIDPKNWDIVSNVPRCMPISNPCVRDSYTGTIHFFLTPTTPPVGTHQLQMPFSSPLLRYSDTIVPLTLFHSNYRMHRHYSIPSHPRVPARRTFAQAPVH